MKFFKLVLIFSLFNFCLHSESKSASSPAKTAKSIMDASLQKSNVQDAIRYVSSEVALLTDLSEKRSTYIFLASLQESISLYEDARKSYVNAAKISSLNASGMPKKSNEQLVLDAVRCALNVGDYKTAESYLNSQVRNTQNEIIQAKIKMYSLWSALCKSASASELEESIVMLKAYLKLPSMSSVKPAILLTLWHLTGSDEWASILKKDFASSLETGIVKGDVKILPSPFWYFLPRGDSVFPLVEDVQEVGTIPESDKIAKDEIVSKSASSSKNETSSKGENVQKRETSSKTETPEPIRKLQLGLFKEKQNAQKLVDTLKQKGFDGYIITETRSSGTTYYLVIVDEKTKSIADTLRTAGFEFYPL
ncbi:MAG: SPOR domain-containing protein [Treponema sp.]|nr:SPOR domain-containing protein [Treponema sp.]